MRVLFSPGRIRLKPRNSAERAVARKIGKGRQVTALHLRGLLHPERIVFVPLAHFGPMTCEMSRVGLPRGFRTITLRFPSLILPLFRIPESLVVAARENPRQCPKLYSATCRCGRGSRLSGLRQSVRLGRHRWLPRVVG